MAEELGLEQLLGEARAVEVDERLVGPRALAVQPAARTPLPAARLALDEDRAVAWPSTRRASAASSRIAGLVPRKGSMGRRSSRDLPAELPAAVALVLEQPLEDHDQGAGSSTGLVRNCSAPSLIACTARSIEPWPVRTMKGTAASAPAGGA